MLIERQCIQQQKKYNLDYKTVKNWIGQSKTNKYNKIIDNLKQNFKEEPKEVKKRLTKKDYSYYCENLNDYENIVISSFKFHLIVSDIQVEYIIIAYDLKTNFLDFAFASSKNTFNKLIVADYLHNYFTSKNIDSACFISNSNLPCFYNVKNENPYDCIITNNLKKIIIEFKEFLAKQMESFSSTTLLSLSYLFLISKNKKSGIYPIITDHNMVNAYKSKDISGFSNLSKLKTEDMDKKVEKYINKNIESLNMKNPYNYEILLEYYDLKLLLKENDKDAIKHRLDILNSLCRFNEVEIEYQKWLKIYKNKDSFRAYILIEFGKLFFNKCDYNAAIDKLKLGARIAKKINYKVGLLNAYYLLSSIYLQLYNSKYSKIYIGKLKSITLELKNYDAYVKLHTCLGNYHFNNNNKDKALLEYNSFYELAKFHDDIRYQSLCLANLGKIYTINKNVNKALFCYKENLRLKEIVGNKLDLLNVHINLGNHYYTVKNNEKSLKHAFKSISIAKELNNKIGLFQISVLLSGLFSRKEEFRKSLYHWIQSYKYMDSATKYYKILKRNITKILNSKREIIEKNINESS